MTPVLKMPSIANLSKTVFIITFERKVIERKFLQINDQFDLPSSKTPNFFKSENFQFFQKTQFFFKKVLATADQQMFKIVSNLTHKKSYQLLIPPSTFFSFFIFLSLPHAISFSLSPTLYSISFQFLV